MAKSKIEKVVASHENFETDELDSEVIFENKTQIPDIKTAIPSKIPVLPLKDIVVYPYMIFPILAGRESSIAAINKSIEKDKFILLVTQLDEKIIFEW